MTTKITSYMNGIRLESSGDGNVTVTAEAPVKVSINTLIAELTSLARNAKAEEEQYRDLRFPLMQGTRLAK